MQFKEIMELAVIAKYPSKSTVSIAKLAILLNLIPYLLSRRLYSLQLKDKLRFHKTIDLLVSQIEETILKIARS